MKKQLLFIGLILLPAMVSAQKIRYKDVFPVIANAPDEEARNELIKYLFTDLHHPNANLRLGMIYERYYQNTDILTDYKRAMAFAEKCKLQYLKSQTIIDEREVSRNEEYYASFATTFDQKGRATVEFETVKVKIRSGYDSAVQFLNKVPPIYDNFTRAVNSYGKAYNKFYNINNTYKSLDDLLMLYDESLEKELLSIKADLDTAISRFKIYQSLIKDYPINDYNQQYSLKPIGYYRLDGLSKSSFLQQDIVLWDYSSWVDEIIASHDKEIVDLRKDVLQVNNNINKTLNNLETASTIEENDILKPDQELIYELTKFDYNSVVLGIFNYKFFKQNLLKKKKQKVYYDTAEHQNINSRLNFYSDLLRQQMVADSLLTALKTRIDDDKIAKHQDFLDKEYGGKQGLTQYVNKEKEQGEKDFNFYKLTLRNDILDQLQLNKGGKESWVNYKNLKIPMFLNKADSVGEKETLVVTSAIDFRADSSSYIAGYLREPGKTRNVGFVARIDQNKKVQWLKEYDISIDSGAADALTRFVDLEITKDGCALVARSNHVEMDLNVNTFIFINDEGTEKINMRLEADAYPRKILYDQGNSRFIVGLKGDDVNKEITRKEPLILVALNTLGDRLWERKFTFAGSFEELLNTQNGYLVIGNYTAITDASNKEHRTRGQMGETNAFIARLSEMGDVSMINIFEKQQPYYITRVYKVNDGNINLFGFNGKFDQEEGELSFTNDNLFHLMINRQLEEITLN